MEYYPTELMNFSMEESQFILEEPALLVPHDTNYWETMLMNNSMMFMSSQPTPSSVVPTPMDSLFNGTTDPYGYYHGECSPELTTSLQSMPVSVPMEQNLHLPSEHTINHHQHHHGHSQQQQQEHQQELMNEHQHYTQQQQTLTFARTSPEQWLGLPSRRALAPWLRTPRQKPTVISHAHTKPLLYCQYCDQPFSRRNSLRRHEMLHTGHKPYQCLPCGRSFSRQDIYKRHCNSRRCMRLTNQTSPSSQ